MGVFEILFGNGEFMMAEVFSIIAATIGAGMAIAGGIAAGVKAKQAKGRLEQGEARNKAEFNQDYYADWLNRSDTLSYLRLLGDKLKTQDKNAQKMNVVHGATPEVQVAQKEKMADAYADAVSKMSSKVSDTRDRVKEMFHRREDAYDNAWIGVKNEEMKNWSNLAQNGISFATEGFKNIGSGFGKTGGKAGAGGVTIPADVTAQTGVTE